MWTPLLQLPASDGSWRQHHHAPDCAFAFLYDPTTPLLPPDVHWRGASSSNNTTSRDAADNLASGEFLYQQVVNYVHQCGVAGCTADEVSVDLGTVHPALQKHQTASARMSEALRDDVLIPTGYSRKTRSDRWAQVLVDAQLKPRWRCAAECKADYRGLWRITPDGQEVPGWAPPPLRLALNHAQHRALAAAANRNDDLGAYVLHALGLDRISDPAWYR